MQVDAENAFNRLNRRVALHNIKEVCPPIQMFLQNHYQKAAKLCVSNKTEPEIMLSDEGCTQGDPAAMHFYSLGAKPMIDKLDDTIKDELCQQSWYADDGSAIGKLIAIKKWWDTLCAIGPKYGYFPEPRKTVLIIKDEKLVDYAHNLFSGTGITITTNGQRHLGAVVGNEHCRNQYVALKVEKWVKDVTELSDIAVEEPQLAYSAFVKGISHRWSFVQRTIPTISNLFKPLEECIQKIFLPSLLGRHISEVQRNILSLPVRFGGLGIANPVETADREYYASKTITQNLTNLILQQEQDISLYCHETMLSTIREVKRAKELHLKEKFSEMLSSLENTPSLKRCLELNTEKGAGSWLTALPLQDHGFCLNKQEFRDAVSLRYGWSIPNTPHFCGCGSKNSVDHTLICMKGGYVSMRHNALRDLNAELQSEVCKDVVIEPHLLPVRKET